jgi:putative ABC transport system permease protein
MELRAGKNFQANSQNENQVIVNEEAVRLWGIPNLQEAVGKTIDMWGEQRTIIGVVKNFHQSTAKDAYVPIIFIYNPYGYRFASIRTHPGDIKKQLAMVENVYQSTFPDSPFEFFFLDQEFESLYRDDVKFQQVFGALTVLAIIIACLGLFGLAVFTVRTRIKEIGIRKVLGSSAWGIISLLSTDFTKMVLTAIIISLPVSYLIASRWLDDFAFHIELEWWFFVGSGLLALMVAWLTVGLQTVKAARVSPTRCLKEE